MTKNELIEEIRKRVDFTHREIANVMFNWYFKHNDIEDKRKIISGENSLNILNGFEYARIEDAICLLNIYKDKGFTHIHIPEHMPNDDLEGCVYVNREETDDELIERVSKEINSTIQDEIYIKQSHDQQHDFSTTRREIEQEIERLQETLKYLELWDRYKKKDSFPLNIFQV